MSNTPYCIPFTYHRQILTPKTVHTRVMKNHEKRTLVESTAYTKAKEAFSKTEESPKNKVKNDLSEVKKV